MLPADWKEVNVGRKRLAVVNTNEEERPFDRQKDNEQYATIVEPKRKAVPPMKQSELDFAALKEEDRAIIEQYEMMYDKDGNSLKWKILKDTEYLKAEDDPMKYPDGPEILRDIGWDNKSKSDIFFTEFFPCIVGHAQMMDEYLADPRASYHTTTVNNKIKFHDTSDEDPDWIVKQCYLLLHASVWEGD